MENETSGQGQLLQYIFNVSSADCDMYTRFINRCLMKVKLIIPFLFLSAMLQGQFVKLYDFGYQPDGQAPLSNLIADGATLFGMTNSGGANNFGTIFKIDKDGANYAKMFDFMGNPAGRYPGGALTPVGDYLYGTTYQGGANNCGMIFKIKPDGTGYSQVFDFEVNASGCSPFSTLYYDGVYLYGTAYTGGGSMGYGGLFKIKPDGTGFSRFFDFSGTTTGSGPLGALISDGTFLYGLTQNGGAGNMGVVFKIRPDGTGFSRLLDFTGSANGSHPKGTLFYDGAYLYGMTYDGGAGQLGVIFKIKPDGTGFSKFIDFTGTPNGGNPRDALISDGVYLYGLTQYGGTGGTGVLFRIKPDGTGFSKLFDFAGPTTGSHPFGSLLLNGNALYGMTNSGGTNSGGTIFKYAILTGMNENKQENIVQVIPNPNNGKFRLNITGLSLPAGPTRITDYQLNIYNILGENIFFDPSLNLPNPVEIDISYAPKGIYFYKISGRENVITGKIVIR